MTYSSQKSFSSQQYRANIIRARPLINVILLISAWVIARALFALANMSESNADAELLTPNLTISGVIRANTQNMNPQDHERLANIAFFDRPNDATLPKWINPILDGAPLVNNVQKLSSEAISKDFHPLLFRIGVEEDSSAPVRTHPSLLPANWDLPTAASTQSASGVPIYDDPLSDDPIILDNHIKQNSASRLRAYGYIFARNGAGSVNALGARYGGSQVAFQTAYRINPDRQSVWDVTLRAQSALSSSGPSERELAVGARIKPHSKFPITAIAERRFRNNSRDGFAFYAAGGQSAIALAAGFTLDIYGQAGISIAGPDTLFFDGSAHVLRPIYSSGNVTISAGAGAWTGGQRQIGNANQGVNFDNVQIDNGALDNGLLDSGQRLDIGPSISINIASGQNNYRISGDWREQIAGNAAPASGAAITLSADF